MLVDLKFSKQKTLTEAKIFIYCVQELTPNPGRNENVWVANNL